MACIHYIVPSIIKQYQYQVYNTIVRTTNLIISIASSISKPSRPISTMASVTTKHVYDRLKEVKQFDESKKGVKGLVDSGITTIPQIFHHPPENLPGPKNKNRPVLTVPVIDLSGERPTVIEDIRRLSSTLGFFQIVNHGVPAKVIDGVVNDMKCFYEQPTEYKMQFYHRETDKGASYSSNFDLYQSKGASWRDTFQVSYIPLIWLCPISWCKNALITL